MNQAPIGSETTICRHDGIEDFISLIQQIDEKSDPNVFIAFGENEVRNALRCKDSKIILIKIGGETAAGGLVWFPNASDKDGDGKHIGLINGGYAQIDNTVVRKDYRGFGFQETLIRQACAIAMKSDVHTVLATVSHENPHSYINFEKTGFQFVQNIQFRNSDRRLYRLDFA